MNDFLLQLLLVIYSLFHAAHSAKFEVIVDILTFRHFLVHHISNISVSLEIIVHLVGLIVAKASRLVPARLQVVLSIPELVLKAHLAEGH